MLKFLRRKKSRLNQAVKDYRDITHSDAYIRVMNIIDHLKDSFDYEAKMCKYKTKTGCKHKKNKGGICTINECNR